MKKNMTNNLRKDCKDCYKKKTLRNYFVKDNEKTKLQNDTKLTSAFKFIILYIFMFLLQGIFNIYLRDWQFDRNMRLLEPYLTNRKIEIMEKIGHMQFLENFFILLITLVVSLVGLYYFNHRYEKDHKNNEE